MKNLIILLITSTLLISCQPEGRVFVEHQDLSPEVEWLKKDTRTFKVPIEDTNKAYNLSLSLRYINGFQYNAARVTVVETSPNGEEVSNEYDLTVRDSEGGYIGEPGYDIWDSEHIIDTNKSYSEKGTYTYTIEHNMPHDPLTHVMEIGVILDEVK